MSLDPEHLRRVTSAGPVIRVIVAEVHGSTPREAGAEMLVGATFCHGTIGGGALEHLAITAARAGREGIERVALGPQRGQCCGGAVTLVYERFDRAAVAAITGHVHARPVPLAGTPAIPAPAATPAAMPLAVQRALARHRNGTSSLPLMVAGWLLEEVAPQRLPVWIWGAGHVGRALVSVLSPLPDVALSWTDTGTDRFPEDIPRNTRQLIAENPADLVSLAPADAHHYILTYSHALDLELCHRLLHHGFGAVGLIGSATKWARFRKRLGDLGHTSAAISQISCPIGDPALGKHPQAIAVGVACTLLRAKITNHTAQEIARGE